MSTRKISVKGRRTAHMTSWRRRGSSGGLIVLWALADLCGRVTLLSGYIQISGSHHWSRWSWSLASYFDIRKHCSLLTMSVQCILRISVSSPTLHTKTMKNRSFRQLPSCHSFRARMGKHLSRRLDFSRVRALPDAGPLISVSSDLLRFPPSPFSSSLLH